MKMLMILMTVLLAAFAYAQEDKESKEPKELTQARTAYQNSVRALVDPVKKKYAAQLEDMKKKLGGKGDVAGATAVQKEIDQLSKVDDVQLDMPDENAIVGTWNVVQDVLRTVLIAKEDHTYRYNNDVGTWEFADGKIILKGPWDYELKMKGPNKFEGTCIRGGVAKLEGTRTRSAKTQK